MLPVLQDPDRQRQLDECGFVTLPVVLDEEARAEVRDHFRRIGVGDVFNQGYNVTQNTPDRAIRCEVHQYLNRMVGSALAPLLCHRTPCTATYMMKEPEGSVVWAHQDWSFCDETRLDSIMCWIPLDDVDERNGALGFIKGSHRFFDYVRGFPVPVAETPVVQHRLRLIPYFQLVPMAAGQALLFNNRTIHGSFPNYTGEERGAVSVSLYDDREPLWTYYIKPDGRCDTLLRYEVTPEFFVDYNNPRLFELYREGKLIEDFPCVEELPYRFDSYPWEAFEEKLAASGNRKDPQKVAQTEAFYSIKLYE